MSIITIYTLTGKRFVCTKTIFLLGLTVLLMGCKIRLRTLIALITLIMLVSITLPLIPFLGVRGIRFALLSIHFTLWRRWLMWQRGNRHKGMRQGCWRGWSDRWCILIIRIWGNIGMDR